MKIVAKKKLMIGLLYLSASSLELNHCKVHLYTLRD